ncbi:MAG: hypothetical protein ACE5HI_15780, partial [bacterium]
WLYIAFFTFNVNAVFAQINQLEFIRTQYFKPTFHIKSWTFDDTPALDRFTEFAIPVVYSLPLGSRFGIDVATSPFLGIKETPNAPTDEFHNITDTFVRSSIILGDNLALLTFGVGIPSGETNLDATEFTISSIASNRPLDNPVSNFGTGLSLNFGLALAQEVGSWVLGFGIGYSLRQKYDATFSGQEFDIEPGNELNLTFGLERDFELSGDRAKFLADFIYTNYAEDKVNGESFYEAGDKFLVRGQLLIPVGFLNPVILTATQRWRSNNRSPNPELISNGNELELRATLIHPLANSFSLKYVAKSQLYGDNDNDSEGATIYGIGGGFILKFSSHVSFDPTFIYSKGSINTGPDSKIDIKGLELNGGFAFRF